MKLIIELSESYVKERTNEEYLFQIMEENGTDALYTLADMIAFKNILDEVNKGETELTVNPHLTELNERERKLFDRTAAMFATIYLILNK